MSDSWSCWWCSFCLFCHRNGDKNGGDGCMGSTWIPRRLLEPPRPGMHKRNFNLLPLINLIDFIFLWHLWKDCFIVIAGALEYCLHLDNMNLTAIRTIRVLRPLRAINRVPSMRILVMLLLGTAHNIFVFHFVWKINRCCKKVAEALKLKNHKVEKTVHKTSAYWS